MRHTKSTNLNVSCLILQLSLSNPLKRSVKLRMKMPLKQHWQAMLQLHLSDQQFYGQLSCDLYYRFDGINILRFYHTNCINICQVLINCWSGIFYITSSVTTHSQLFFQDEAETQISIKSFEIPPPMNIMLCLCDRKDIKPYVPLSELD